MSFAMCVAISRLAFGSIDNLVVYGNGVLFVFCGSFHFVFEMNLSFIVIQLHVVAPLDVSAVYLYFSFVNIKSVFVQLDRCQWWHWRDDATCAYNAKIDRNICYSQATRFQRYSESEINGGIATWLVEDGGGVGHELVLSRVRTPMKAMLYPLFSRLL